MSPLFTPLQHEILTTLASDQEAYLVLNLKSDALFLMRGWEPLRRIRRSNLDKFMHLDLLEEFPALHPGVFRVFVLKRKSE